MTIVLYCDYLEYTLKKLSTHLRVIFIALAAIVVVSGSGLFIASRATSACNQQYRAQEKQLQQQADELQSIMMFGTKPQLDYSPKDTICLNKSGSVNVASYYEVHGIGLLSANSEVQQTLGGTEQPLAAHADDSEGGDNVSNGVLNTLETTISASGHTYYVWFTFVQWYKCPMNAYVKDDTSGSGGCDASNQIIQHYGLQNRPVSEVEIAIKS